MNRLKRIAIAIIIAVLLLLIVTGSVAATLTGPDYTNVDTRAFVYAEDSSFILALPSGSYTIEGQWAEGCYHLTPPDPGQPHGTAAWVWFTC